MRQFVKEKNQNKPGSDKKVIAYMNYFIRQLAKQFREKETSNDNRTMRK